MSQLAFLQDEYVGTAGEAFISPCGRYRYFLSRRWAEGPMQCWVMLNPSDADATQDDPTIARLQIRARTSGFAAIWVVNMYGYRSPDPKRLWTVPDPIGEHNDKQIWLAVQGAKQTVCAWGGNARPERVQAVLRLLAGRPLYALGFTKDGQPSHPLYIPYEVKPALWKPGNKHGDEDEDPETYAEFAVKA